MAAISLPDTIGAMTAAERLVSPCGRCDARRLSVCQGVDDRCLDQLAAAITTIRLQAHATLASEGDEASHFFNITSGAVKLFKLLPDGRQQIVGFLFPGDFVGLAVRDTYAYTVETIAPATACRFDRRQFERLLERFPNMAFRLRERASDELAIAQEQMLSLGRKSAKERVASFLLQLSRRAVRLGLPGNPVTLPMTRADIADYLGLTIETVSRTITRLKTSRIITLGPDHTVTLHRERLEEIGEGWGGDI
ncbi:Crp/Fnr family transcriptional regulator [Aliidongia dinghuensis]|uniref:Crp/Fnr family transcriptional regulator n=1 Tax=Aliidongia dinghuensis TaxID=1867774 RepID=A0A8J2YYZ0_9PROT|nr:Crp/Fnr family transcriptional regulator [Aliidongia dinghuensis]GGF43662.1 Crp/Fnr family transcriptional regulator [Aliidongia dinghuensis]